MSVKNEQRNVSDLLTNSKEIFGAAVGHKLRCTCERIKNENAKAVKYFVKAIKHTKKKKYLLPDF